ncbi:MAG: hypothetical protein EOL95_06865 [Bacteroidia bacterium]|nr:hypothetical protein [Bacteroidia bacterium]
MRKTVTSLCMCLLLALAACSNPEPNSRVIGTYELSSVNMNGKELTIDQIILVMETYYPNMNFDCLKDNTLELKTDYTFESVQTCESPFDMPLTFGNGTYQIVDKNITLTETETETVVEGIVADDYNSFTVEMTVEIGDIPMLVKITLTKK